MYFEELAVDLHWTARVEESCTEESCIEQRVVEQLAVKGVLNSVVGHGHATLACAMRCILDAELFVRSVYALFSAVSSRCASCCAISS